MDSGMPEALTVTQTPIKHGFWSMNSGAPAAVTVTWTPIKHGFCSTCSSDSYTNTHQARILQHLQHWQLHKHPSSMDSAAPALLTVTQAPIKPEYLPRVETRETFTLFFIYFLLKPPSPLGFLFLLLCLLFARLRFSQQILLLFLWTQRNTSQMIQAVCLDKPWRSNTAAELTSNTALNNVAKLVCIHMIMQNLHFVLLG